MMALCELKSLSPSVGSDMLPCNECNATGGLPIPPTYQEVWGRTLINGQMVCLDCDGTGIEGGRSV